MTHENLSSATNKLKHKHNTEATDPVELKQLITDEILATGASAVGFAKASRVDGEVIRRYKEWIAGCNHAGMDYLARHTSLKSDPRNVLHDVATVISIAYSYAPAEWRDPSLPVIAAYAYGDDYHDVLRTKLTPVMDRMKERFGGSWRICIDSAPLPERYWAIRCGIGRRGMNGSVIVDGCGSYVFLAELLTSHPLPPDSPSGANYNKNRETYHNSDSETLRNSEINCDRCGKCLEACPQKALKADGTIDCRRCLNYLTIEHRGDWEGDALKAMHTPAGRNTLFGCDICQRVCPHNRHIAPTNIPEFHPRKGILHSNPKDFKIIKDLKDFNTLTLPTDIDGFLTLSQDDFSRLFKGSPIKRTKLAGILRNASNLIHPGGLPMDSH